MGTLRSRSAVHAWLAVCAAVFTGAAGVLSGVCGPFTDVSDPAFCPFVLEIFYLGITTGTSPTTYDPTSSVTRLQMAAFLSRTVDGALRRGSRRAALDQFWTPQNEKILALTTVGTFPLWVRCDGADLWVSNTGNSVSRVRASDGKLLETWTGATTPAQIAVAMGRIFVAGFRTPGNLYEIDPSQPAGAAATVSSLLGDRPEGIAFDGARLWTANYGDGSTGGTVSIVTPGPTIPWTVTTVATGFAALFDALFDGTNVWVTDFAARTLLRLNSSGAILQTVTLGTSPNGMVFDGSNIWVTNGALIVAVRASTGTVVATVTGNGLTSPYSAAFDGQRVLVTNNADNSVSLFKAADLTPLGVFPTGASTAPFGSASDGIHFWIALNGVGKLARF